MNKTLVSLLKIFEVMYDDEDTVFTFLILVIFILVKQFVVLIKQKY